MKQRDLLAAIRRGAKAADLVFEFMRHGGEHDVYTLDGRKVIVPRHAEINELTAKGILKAQEDKLGKDWWK